MGEDLERSPDDPPMFADSIYHTAHVVKDYPHEVSTLWVETQKFYELF